MENNITIYGSYVLNKYDVISDNITDLRLNQLDTNNSIYVTFSYNDKPCKVVNINKLITDLPNIDYNTTVYHLLVQYMTDLIYDGLDDIGSYSKQTLNVLDPFSTNSVCVQYGNLGQVTTSDNTGDKVFCRDLLITLDNHLNPNNCLVWVNGVFHNTMAVDKNTVGVVDGYLNIQRCEDKSVLLVNTDNLGGSSTLPILRENILNSIVSHRSILTFENETLSDYTVLLVIDGSLYTPIHNVYKVINDTTIFVDNDKIDYIDQFRHNPNMVPYMTKPSIKSTYMYPSVSNDDDLRLFNDDYVTNGKYLKSQEFQIRRLSSTQSFIIKIKNKHLLFSQKPIVSNNDPNQYIYYGSCQPNGILYYNNIHQVPYTITKDMIANLIPCPLIETLKDYRVFPTFKLYVKPTRKCDDLGNYTRENNVYTSTYMDHETPRVSPDAYILEINSYTKK